MRWGLDIIDLNSSRDRLNRGIPHIGQRPGRRDPAIHGHGIWNHEHGRDLAGQRLSRGGSATGTISNSGLYTAPSSIPTPSTTTITAVSSADSTKTATATVTILPPPVSVAVSPTTAGVIILHSQQFAATVSNTSNTAVVWSVGGTTGGSATVGTISTSGLYTAPSAVPSAPIVTVTATSVADTTKSASSQVTISPPPVPTGTWSSLGPAGASDLLQLVADPNNVRTVYATSTIRGGLFKTVDLGKNWSQLLPNDANTFTILIAPASGTLYLLYSDHFRTSTDGGKTLSAAVTYPNAMYIGNTAFTIAVDPQTDQTLYVLTNTTLMRSKDGGLTRVTLTSPVSPYLPSANQVHLGTLLVANGNSSKLFCATSTGIAISKDGGLTWQVQTGGLDPNASNMIQVTQDPLNPSRVLSTGIKTGPGGRSYFYTSLDGGIIWAQQGTSLVGDLLAVGQSGPGVYYIAGGGLYVTFDAGATYQNVGPPNDSFGYTAVISPLSANTIIYEGANDVSTSQDGGRTWSISQTGMNMRSMGQIVYAGATGPLYAGTLTSRYSWALLKSSSQLWSAGNTNGIWSRLVDMYAGLPVLKFDVDPQDPLRIVGLQQQSTVLNGAESSAISTNGGLTWTSIPYASGMEDQFSYFRFSEIYFGGPGSNSAFACGDFGVARLSTITNIWTITNNGFGTGESCRAVGVDRATSATVYAATTGGVYKSVDGGNNWSLLYLNPGSTARILFDPKNSNNVFVSGGFSMRSTDAGKSWTPMSVGGVMAIDPIHTNLMYVVATNSMYASADSGLTWASLTPPVNFMEDVAVTASGTVVITTNGSGVVAFTPN